MGRVRAASLVLAALAAGLLLGGCGSGGGAELLPGTTADQITSNLDQARASFEEGNCEGAENAVAAVSTQVDALEKVDPQLKKALLQGALKLSQVVSTCGAAEKAEEEKAALKAEEEQEQLEAEARAEQESFEKEQKAEEREQKAQEKAEEHAEQPGPSEESKGKAKGHEKQEEAVEPPEGKEEVTPPAEGGAGGIGPSAAVEGGGP
ncbi:MAG: hypothetical protein JSU06_14355 [Actinobacteria bacterium]|nr:hypothetical protein [Actinomycetota bacterium]